MKSFGAQGRMRGVVRHVTACVAFCAAVACAMVACRRGADASVLGQHARDQLELTALRRDLTGTPFLDTPVGGTLRALLPSDFRYWNTASEPIVLLGRTDLPARANGISLQRSWRMENAASRGAILTQP